MSGNETTDPRGKQLAIGAAILLVVAVGFVSLLILWRKIPGLIGESVGMLVGVMSTPFFMEASFVLLGLMIVVGLNSWRRHREGDEFVSMEKWNDSGKKQG